MKIIFNLLFLLSCIAAISQRSNELLVYSVKGTVTVIENKKESPLKIGKILKPASVIKTQQGARITMICEQGQLLNLNKKGSFPVQHWKDSCSMVQSNLTADYFRYIWQEMVGKHQGNNSGNGGVRRSDRSKMPEAKNARLIKTVKNDTYIKVDTLSFASGNFPLLRVGKTDSKKCLFVIIADNGEEVYKDSLSSPIILTNTMIQHLQPGNSYSWTARFEKNMTDNSGVLNYLSVESKDKFIVGIEKATCSVY